MHYPFETVERRWQERWAEQGLYKVDPNSTKPKYYVLDMFPYPSGAGLHMGHPEGYTATDIVSRFKRMSGFNVLHPMGFDAFGLPTERYSMTTGIHPAVATAQNVETYTRQLNMFGFDYDWTRVVNTTKPEYYKWTQWMFLKIYNSWYDDAAQRARPIHELPIPSMLTTEVEIEAYKDQHRLAFIAHSPVNWCEALGTVLANEEVDEWKEKGYTVERRQMRQWMLRITAYADRLLTDLETVDWPSSTKDMQRHWIGKSQGAVIHFALPNSTNTIEVFTTRPDTLFGATYMVLAPEHPLVDTLTTTDAFKHTVQEYIQAASLKSDLERTELNKEKTGVFIGSYAVNPATGEQVQVWIADYVLAHYGTGAIMAVPGHDARDFDFATEYSLPIVRVVTHEGSEPESPLPQVQYGVSVNSENSEISLNGLSTKDAQENIITWISGKGLGSRKIQFRLRDWLFSRQRYWGEPIPIMFFEDGTKRCLDEDELPLVLPEVSEYKPAGTGESPLATVDSWVNFVDTKTGKQARFETNTMPQWAGSCWYYLRYCDPHNNEIFCSENAEEYWMGRQGVDLYVGGGEHAVLHLLYARFWHKVLFDYGLVKSSEPFHKLFHQGLILGTDGRKMSKSLGNSVNPDIAVAEFGADALRLYEMFMGPLEASKPWNTNGVEGISRFLDRVWRLVVGEDGEVSAALQNIECTPEQDRVLHYTIKKTAEDIEALSLNTSVAQFMIFVNEFTTAAVRPRLAVEAFLQCLAPFAPHITAELWNRLGYTESIHVSAFPSYDEAKLTLDNVEIVVQVNSKIRGKVLVSTTATNEEMESEARADASVIKHIGEQQVRKVIVVPGKLVNFIVG
ncbi:MAG: leucine--tRNA ligase [Ignavibacteria bacterium]|nr:leucine--tRNA ligase [Ignavibacteria bacterium]